VIKISILLKSVRNRPSSNQISRKKSKWQSDSTTFICAVYCFDTKNDLKNAIFCQKITEECLLHFVFVSCEHETRRKVRKAEPNHDQWRRVVKLSEIFDILMNGARSQVAKYPQFLSYFWIFSSLFSTRMYKRWTFLRHLKMFFSLWHILLEIWMF